MEISLSILFLWSFVFIIIGAIIMLLLQYYIYIKFSLLPEPTVEQNAFNAKYSLPASLNATARNFQMKPSAATLVTETTAAAPATTTTTTTTTSTTTITMAKFLNNNKVIQVDDTNASSLISLNFVMQFLFHELKNENRVRKWFYRKLSLELDELIAKTTTGRLFDKLTIKQLELGDQFPEINALKVHNIALDENGARIENLDLLMELHYNGNFRTSIDADMVLGKKGSLTLKIKQLGGLARLQFTRNPYTHWSLSFLGDPELDLDIESKYQGRQMQSNITSLISNQIRKAIRRKHTLPNYKIRYKPFFHKIGDNEDVSDNDIQPNGVLQIKISEISRLMCPTNIIDIYCTLTMASVAFVEAHQYDDRHLIVSLDVEIHKAKNQQIGIIFKQATADTIEIEAILPNTPACKSNLKLGDIVLAIEGKRVATIQQVAKIIKTIQNTIIKLRIDRIMPGIIRNDAILEDLDIYEDLDDNHLMHGNVIPVNSNNEINVKQTILGGTSQIEKGTSSETSLVNTPTNSPKKTKLIAKALKKTISRDFGDSHESHKIKIKSSNKLINLPKDTTRVVVENLLNATRNTTNITNTTNTTANTINTANTNNINSFSNLHDVEHYFQHSTIDCKLTPIIYMEDLSQFKLDTNCRYLNVCVYGKNVGEHQLLGFTNISINQILMECSETSLCHNFKICELNPPLMQDLKYHNLATQSGFNPNLCFGDIFLTFSWQGNPNISIHQENLSKQGNRLKAKSITSLDKTDDSSYSDTISIKSIDTLSIYSRSHNFIRTHFQRATQCDFCGKKIWLKDAVQCRDCYMCCHKKCINKCQNATVCGPVDCNMAATFMNATVTTKIKAITTSTISTPEFTLTEPLSSTSPNNQLPMTTATTTTTNTSSYLDVQRSNFTNLFNQNIKRVNSVNNLAIPGLGATEDSLSVTNKTENSISSVASSTLFAKSLPPTPQHSPPSRKSTLVASKISTNNIFNMITKNLEMLPNDFNCLAACHTYRIIEPLSGLSKYEDAMIAAKDAGKNLYSDLMPALRVEKINSLLIKLRFIMDNKAHVPAHAPAHAPAHVTPVEDIAITDKLAEEHTSTTKTTTSPQPPPAASAAAAAALSSTSSLSISTVASNASSNLGNSDESIQALSVIMLYLCTGLQHAQNVAAQ